MIRRGYGPFNTKFCYFFNIGRFFFRHSKNKDKFLRDSPAKNVCACSTENDT